MSEKKKEKGILNPAPDEQRLELWRKALGGQLAVERDIRGFTQEEMAVVMGVTQKSISKIENGTTPNIDKFIAHSVLLGVPFHLIAARAHLIVDADERGESSPLPSVQRASST
jgi:transcriptional regulator with XRE-family HTH domain